jgi:hypothetical protein
MKKFIYSTLLFLIIIFQSHSQEKKSIDYERVYIEAGMFYPLGNLKNRVEPSPNFGFWLKTKIKEDQFYDIGFNVSIQKNRDNFNFEKQDSVFSNKAKGLSGMIGIRYCKTFSISSNYNVTLDWFPSFGYGFFMYKSTFTNFKNDTKLVINGISSTRGLSTIHLGQGIKLNIDNVAFQLQYQYAPYSLFYNYIDNDFGSQSLIFGIVYKQ